MGNLFVALLGMIVQLFVWLLNVIASIFKTVFNSLRDVISSISKKHATNNNIKALQNLKDEIELSIKNNNEMLSLSQQALTYPSIKNERTEKTIIEDQYLYCKQLNITLNASLKDVNIDLSKIGSSDFNYHKEKYSNILSTIKGIRYPYDKSKLLSISQNNTGLKSFIKEILEFANVEKIHSGTDEWTYQKDSIKFRLKLDEKADTISISAKSFTPIAHTPSPKTTNKVSEKNVLLSFDKQNELVISFSRKADQIDHYDVYEFFRNVNNLLNEKEINEYANQTVLSYRQALDIEDNVSELLDGLRKISPPPADYMPDHEKMHGGKQRWAQISDVERLGMLSNEGFLIGKMGYGSLIYTGPYNSHILTVASVGSGKGTGVVIPNLLKHKGSAVVLDPKGENFIVTAKRRYELGTKVFYFDPWDIIKEYSQNHNGSIHTVGIKATINPLDFILPTDPDIMDKANRIASSLIVRTSDNDTYFYDSAELLLSRMIVLICIKFEKNNLDRNLIKLREFITSDKKFVLAMLAHELKKPNCPIIIREFHDWMENIIISGNKGVTDIYQFAQNATSFLMSPQVQASIKTSNVDVQQIKITPMSIYLILDMNKLTFNANYYMPLIRLMVITITFGVSSVHQPKEKVLFMLDEIAQLGQIQYLPQFLAIYRGKGVVVWTIWQNIAQIKALYEKEWQSIVGNCDVQQFFGVNDIETAEYVSKMAGQTTIYEESFNTSYTNTSSHSETQSFGEQYSSGSSHSSGSSDGYSYQGFNYSKSGGNSQSSTTNSNYTDSYNFSRMIQTGKSFTTGKNMVKKIVPLISQFDVTTGNAFDVQFVFYTNKCPYPILSGKIKYYEDMSFYGKYTDNITLK